MIQDLLTHCQEINGVQAKNTGQNSLRDKTTLCNHCHMVKFERGPINNIPMFPAQILNQLRETKVSTNED